MCSQGSNVKSAKKSQWLDLESKLDSILDGKNSNTFLSPKNTIKRDSLLKSNVVGMGGHSKVILISLKL